MLNHWYSCPRCKTGAMFYDPATRRTISIVRVGEEKIPRIIHEYRCLMCAYSKGETPKQKEVRLAFEKIEAQVYGGSS